MLKIFFLGLMSTGIPVAIAMAGASLIYILISGDLPGFTVVHRMIGGIDSFPLLAVPFFILAGNLMNNAGITNRIYNYALALVGWLKGGLGHVNVLGSVIFAGMSGTAIADAAGLGTIEIKAMKDHGYATEFAVGVTAASATLGPIIPPSLPFVIYAMMANVSVGALFLAGILPGVLMAVLMMLTVAYFAHKNGWGGDIKFVWSRFGGALIETAVVIAWPLALYYAVQWGAPAQATVITGLVVIFLADWKFKFQAVLPIMTPVLLIGGMTTGLFTPTEGAIAACVWAMVLGLFWYRTLSWRMFVKVCLDTVETTATVMFIVAAASIFGWMLTATGVTAAIADWVLAFTKEPWLFLLLMAFYAALPWITIGGHPAVFLDIAARRFFLFGRTFNAQDFYLVFFLLTGIGFLLIVNLLVFILGCFIDFFEIAFIAVPLLAPVAHKLGNDPVWFGVMLAMNLQTSFLTPPFGFSLFYLRSVAPASIPTSAIYRGVLPFIALQILMVIMVALFPQLVGTAQKEQTVWDMPTEFVEGGGTASSADEAIRIMEEIARDLHNEQKAAGAE